MIDWIRVKGFKSIADSGFIEIRPVTLLMGPNSAGKSSIIQPLLAMRQTVDSRDVDRAMVFDGSYVSLGPFQEFVHGHKIGGQLCISFQISTDEPLLRFFVDRESPTGQPVPDKTTLVFEGTLSASAGMTVHTQAAKYELLDRSGSKLTVTKTRGPRGKTTGEITLEGETQKFSFARTGKFYDVVPMGKHAPIRRRMGMYGPPLSYLTSRLSATVEAEFSRLFYIGPLRDEPMPVYVATGERPQDVGPTGQDAMQILWLSKRERKLIEVRKQVAKWMQEFQIASEVSLREREWYFYLAMKDFYSGLKVKLSSVGFGASQILPLIVQGYYAPRQSMIIAEQPEIHLHPRAQGTLGDLIIDIAGRGKKFIIETHSEHMLSRIQRRVAEGTTIKKDDVIIYYCHATEKGTSVEPIRLNELGQFEPQGLPSDFFSEDLDESRAHWEAIVKKTNAARRRGSK